MTNCAQAEHLHRLIKQAIDSGAAASVEDAEALFRRYRLQLEIAPADAKDPGAQATLLTAVALARRVFLGGVDVVGDLSSPLMIPLPLGPVLGEAVVALGGSVHTGIDPALPLISIAGVPKPRAAAFHIRAACAGWRGGVVPATDPDTTRGGLAMPLAAMLAAAIGVSEAFFYVRGDCPAAGRRRLGLSLWRPDSTADWINADDGEPALSMLPSKIWLIGLGHLGQAYLWALGLLPYAPNESGLHLVLQDVDIVTPSTDSTGILTHGSMLGLRKTRVMASWAEGRGFTTAIHERLFDANFRRQDEEPVVALCGLDNALGRRALDEVGFSLVIEAGLGRGHRDFRTMRLHTLPASRRAVEIWSAAPTAEDVSNRAAYRKLLEEGVLDKCGVTLLAGKAVGAPFVGSVAATLAVAELLRVLHGGMVTQLIDLDLSSIEHRTVVAQRRDFSSLNPGYVTAQK